MTENNGSAKKEDPKFDGVLDELRSVLSGLGRTPPAPEPAPQAAPFGDAINDAEHRSVPAPDKSPSSGEPLASDADFWNGNVLGWPSNADADLPEPPAMKQAPVEPSPSDNGFLREDAAENGFTRMEERESPEPVVPAAREPDRPPAAEEPNIFVPVDPDPAAPEVWALNAEEIIPSAPPAPDAAVPPSPPLTPMADPWLHPGLGVDAPAIESALPVSEIARPEPILPPATEFAAPMNEPPVEAPAPAVKPAADFEFELPIPGTIETREKPVADASPHLELDGTELKPDDLVQIACIYPQGQEKAGQAFVNKLREAAEKMRRPMTVQAVFVSGWTPDKIDPAAWAKSASLSGADAIFVLTFRASANLFRDLASAMKGGPRSRVVMLEQVNFPTLYADILVELRRSR